MRLEMQSGTVRVTLSRRNLKALLAKLAGYPVSSNCTISYGVPDVGMLFVSAEPNDIHYANPERDSPVPGAMHSETEERLRRWLR